MLSSWRADRYLGWLLPVFAIVAEGALVAVVYVAVEVAIDHRPPLLGTFEFAVAAGIAAATARRGWIDPDADAVRFLVLLGALGFIGWMWDAEVRELVLGGDPLAAVPLHPGGWLLLVAGMRGIGRAFEVDDRAVTRLVLIGVPALAVPWALGQLGAGPLREVFTEEAFVTSVTFVTAGFIAAGLARLREIGRETGVDWRHNRSWLGTVFGIIAVVLAIGIPASILLGLPGDAIARGILGPLVTVIGYLLIGGLALAALIAALLSRVLHSLGIQLPEPLSPEEIARLPEAQIYTIDQLRESLTALIAIWVVIVVVLIVLARVWLRRRQRRGGPSTGEERSIRIPQRATRVRAPRRPRRQGRTWTRPYDAVTAYLAALRDLAAGDPSAARGEHETPRAHAARVSAGPELAALQADYALARYGGRALTDAEHRRAIGRWQRLRRRPRAPDTPP
jgi:hypothetical protein